MFPITTELQISHILYQRLCFLSTKKAARSVFQPTLPIYSIFINILKSAFHQIFFEYSLWRLPSMLKISLKNLVTSSCWSVLICRNNSIHYNTLWCMEVQLSIPRKFSRLLNCIFDAKKATQKIRSLSKRLESKPFFGVSARLLKADELTRGVVRWWDWCQPFHYLGAELTELLS